jgi:Na+-translocating ferredoxin:NAD+ oxidoreductase RnfD subunit
MYFWVIALLVFITAVAIYNKQNPTWNLLISVTTACLLDIFVKKVFLKREIRFPASAFITGGIIGGIAPYGSPVLLLVLAAGAAIASKFLIRLKGHHIFNPATFGLVVGLAIFGLGDQWWIAESVNVLGYAIVLTPLLIIPNYKARRYLVSLPFLAVTGILMLATGYVNVTGTASAIGLLLSLPYFLAFIMVSEPRTSPSRTNEQIVYGSGVAVLTFIFVWYGMIYALLVPLLIGNIGYALYRSFLVKA